MFATPAKDFRGYGVFSQHEGATPLTADAKEKAWATHGHAQFILVWVTDLWIEQCPRNCRQQHGSLDLCP